MKMGWRLWVLIIAIVFSILAIRPSFESGVLVKSVEPDSPAFQEGLRQGAHIIEVNGQAIEQVSDYARALGDNNSQIAPSRIEIKTEDADFVFFTNESLGLTVQNKPRTRLKSGLDIQGGARALVRPEQNISDAQLSDLIAVSNNRFNVFGISDVKIRGVKDLQGNKFMLIEVAGASPSDLENLVAKQGKFEARIGNETVFVGGNEDISSVCRNDATCAGVTGCFPSQSGGYICNFAFTLYLSPDAAKHHAEITEKIEIDYVTGGQYLKGNLTLVLDDKIVDTLLISKDLKGRETTQISIQGSGSGVTQEEALADARASMHKLQTVLITGSLPHKLEIVKLDTISPSLGGKFVYILLLAGMAAIVVVSIIVFIRYRKIKESLAVLVTSFSEIIIILGVAALIGWNLDLPAIAGILATIGTGVDQQIIILDEARRARTASMRERMKRAIFVVMSAYATALVSLLPLYWAGAGLFKGFAITTIIGITAGVLISRPAFAEMIRKIEE
ncbi:MAG: PDZ domain-containing protein [Nanoarchaeota archaeon]